MATSLGAQGSVGGAVQPSSSTTSFSPPSTAPAGKKLSSRDNVPLARVRRQRQEIDDIKHNNEIIRLDAIRGSREAKVNVNSGAAMEVGRLQDQAQLFFAKIQVEKKKIHDLEEQIKAAQIRVLEQKQKMGGVNASKENDTMIAKQIRTLENRLDKALIKFNESLAENKQLRERIDHLRIDRVVFDNVYKRLERSLHEKKKEMAAVIEDAKLACIARDKAKSELATIKQQAEKAKLDFEVEWKELGRLIEDDRRMREALKRKLENAQAEAKFGEGTELAEGDHGLQDKALNNYGYMKDKTDSITISMEKLQYYEECFVKVQEATGIADVEELVTKFLESEDKNFSLFNYVNELNNEIEQLELMIADTKAEIEKHKGQGVSTDTQQKRTLRMQEERLKRTKDKADEYENKHLNAMKAINQLKTGISGIFSRLGCNNTPTVEEMLGNQGVTESNMMQYLGIIEQRTIEILQTYAQSQMGNGADGNMGLPGGGAVKQPPPMKPTVQPPASDDFSSGEESGLEDEDRPLTREELQKKSLRILNKKEKHSKAGRNQGQRKN